MAQKRTSKNLQKLIDMLTDESADWCVKAVLEESETEAPQESDAGAPADSSETPQESEEGSQNQAKADSPEKTDLQENQK